MTLIHENLQVLGPVVFSEVPTDDEHLKAYLERHFDAAKFLLESIPQPIQASNTRSRAVSSASSSADISISSARTETPIEHEPLQKDWGKPVRLSEKDNPLGINVWKLSGQDGRGAWFARRSVHEGLSFAKWKKGLQEEFEHSLQIEGGPGSGKVRGLGAEERPESKQMPGVGTLDVWHVSAQFPGPSAPRDFVSLVLTSDCAYGEVAPKNFLVVSKPCEHQKLPPRDGLVRGEYESVEFIREIPRSNKAASSTNLLQKENIPLANDAPISPGRARGRTIGFAESRGHHAKGESIDLGQEEVDPNPVEWIMITRSDPGGSVPRFLVERGTPGGIVSDASKFLDWACKRDFTPEIHEPRAASEAASIAESKAESEIETQSTMSAPVPLTKNVSPDYPPSEKKADEQPGILASTTNAAQAVLSSIIGFQPPPEGTTSRRSSISSTISSDSFASASSSLNISSSLHATSIKSTSSGPKPLTAQDKELLRLANRKAELAEKLNRSRDRAFKDATNPTDKETQWLEKKKSEHDREVAKAEDRYVKSLRAIEDRKVKEEEKARLQIEYAAKREEDRKRKAELKETERKEREARKVEENKRTEEIRGYKEQIIGLQKERDQLKENVRMLQGQNTKLVTLVGKMDGGERLLREGLGLISGAVGGGDAASK